jgi:alpha-tubulin suppressor-like RCC1 family protein
VVVVPLLLGLALGCSGGEPAPLTGAVIVSVGNSHACAGLADGTVACWGSNFQGQLARPTTTFVSGTPATVPGVSGVTALASGDYFTCALAKGVVTCWGSNGFAQLGNGGPFASLGGAESSADHDETPIAVSGLPALATLIAAGGTGDGASQSEYAFVSLVDGTVSTWGQNTYALAAIRGGSPALPPTAFPGLTNVHALALSGPFGCALLADSTVTCWGAGPLGRGAILPMTLTTLEPVPGLDGVIAIAAGIEQACALKIGGTVWCWGTFAPDASASPVQIPMLSGVTAIAAGGFDVCALRGDGTVVCWGPTTRSTSKMPVSIAGVAGATAIDVGGVSACAVIAGGHVRCWGQNLSGELGDGTNATTDDIVATPVTVVAVQPNAPP